jgi:hypothetical protein
LKIPVLHKLLISVVRFKPSLAAAPFGAADLRTISFKRPQNQNPMVLGCRAQPAEMAALGISLRASD